MDTGVVVTTSVFEHHEKIEGFLVACVALRRTNVLLPEVYKGREMNTERLVRSISSFCIFNGFVPAGSPNEESLYSSHNTKCNGRPLHVVSPIDLSRLGLQILLTLHSP
jgi:hypothetical protein